MSGKSRLAAACCAPMPSPRVASYGWTWSSRIAAQAFAGFKKRGFHRNDPRQRGADAGYSARRVRAGSMLAARRAGAVEAPTAISCDAARPTTYGNGSVRPDSNRKACTSVEPAAARRTPTRYAQAAVADAWRSTDASSRRGLAPDRKPDPHLASSTCHKIGEAGVGSDSADDQAECGERLQYGPDRPREYPVPLKPFGDRGLRVH